MTTCLDIITRAYRMAGGLRDPAQALDATDAAIGLTELQSIILTLPGSTHWTDVEVTAAYTVGENERLFNTTDASITITIPAMVSSAGKVLDCCDRFQLVCTGRGDRLPKDGARFQIAYSGATYRYCSDAADWLRVDSLALTDPLPLNGDLHLQFAAMLALILSASEGLDAPATTQRLAIAGQSTMRARFGKRQDVAVDTALINTSSRCG